MSYTVKRQGEIKSFQFLLEGICANLVSDISRESVPCGRARKRERSLTEFCSKAWHVIQAAVSRSQTSRRSGRRPQLTSTSTILPSSSSRSSKEHVLPLPPSYVRHKGLQLRNFPEVSIEELRRPNRVRLSRVPLLTRYKRSSNASLSTSHQRSLTPHVQH